MSSEFKALIPAGNILKAQKPKVSLQFNFEKAVDSIDELFTVFKELNTPKS